MNEGFLRKEASKRNKTIEAKPHACLEDSFGYEVVER